MEFLNHFADTSNKLCDIERFDQIPIYTCFYGLSQKASLIVCR